MAENRSSVLSEAELRALREILVRARANDVESLQRQVKSIGAGLADMMVKAVVSLEGGLTEMRGHLKVAIETMMEQAEELEALKEKTGGPAIGAGGIPDLFPLAPSVGAQDDGLLARVSAAEAQAMLVAATGEDALARVTAVEKSVREVRDRVERALEMVDGAGEAVRSVGTIKERLDRMETIADGAERLLGSMSAGAGAAPGGLLGALSEHVYLISRALARGASDARIQRAEGLCRVADEIERTFVPRMSALRREPGRSIGAYDGFRALEEEAREACEDLRRVSRRLAAAGQGEAQALATSAADAEERLDSVRELLALGGLTGVEDPLDSDLRRAVRECLISLVDLATQLRDSVEEAERVTFEAAAGELLAAGRLVGLQTIVPAPGTPIVHSLHEADDAPAGAGGQVTSVVAQGYRIGDAIIRRARVRLG